MGSNVKICYGCMKKISGDVCPCGWNYNYSREESITLLPPGTVLGNGKYRIGRKIGQGGFGITYLGVQQDRLGIRVAIKEYFPRKLVHRNISVSGEVFPNNPPGMSEADAADISSRFESGKQQFIEEAQRLAGFNELPSIVSVLGYVEENNTAYIVMEYIDGIDLQHYMQNLGRTLTFQEVREYVFPIMEDLDKVHRSGIIHRDISPDNIMLSHNGSVKLIDFGASVSQEGEEQLRVLRKNGFAPLEQYDSRGDHLGPWTDVYAFCATVFMLLTGQMLQDARDRSESDQLPSFRDMQLVLPKKLEKILKKGLAVEYKKRYQSMHALYRRLNRVQDHRKLTYWLESAALLCAAVMTMGMGTFSFSRETMELSGAGTRVESILTRGGETCGMQADSAPDYAVFDELVYIRYVFDDGQIMLARSPVGADDISDVEYVSDGPIGNFCVYENFLYFISTEDQCLYRIDLEDEARSWVRISRDRIDQEFPFCVSGGYIYALLREEGRYEFLRLSVDGVSRERTQLRLPLELCRFYEGYIYMTTREEGETVLSRMKMDGTCYEALSRFQGDIPAMVIEEGYIYYLFNSADESRDSCVGCMKTNGSGGRELVSMGGKELKYCYMTGIVDHNNIYYTCSHGGAELLNNLYCYSISDENNKQISSECGRYIATSDEINCIIFASEDGSELRQMNKDGSNPRTMREADGSPGVREQVDITSLAIIRDHVYYLDGESVAYKQIEEEEL